MKSLIRTMMAGLIRWAVVEADGGDRGPIPWQQVRYLGKSGRATAWYPYGFSAVAPSGSLAVLLQFAGQASRVELPGSPKQRPPLKPGEVAVYHPDTGSSVVFRSDGSVEVSAVGDLAATTGGDATLDALGAVSVLAGTTLDATAGTSATVTAPAIVANGDVTVNGDLTVTGDTTLASVVTSQGKDISDSHRHPTTDGGSPGNTGVPV